MPSSAPKSPRPRPAPALGSFAPRRPLAAPRLPPAEPSLPVAGDAVARAERFGHHFDRLTVAEGSPPSHGQRGPVSTHLAASVVQRKPGLKVGFASDKKGFNLSIAGRPKSFAKKVDKTLSTDESEKPYYDDSGTLKEGFVRGHIVEWNTKRRALESRLKGMDKASLTKSLGLPSGAQDRQVQGALLAHVKGEYSNPANLAITDASDHDEGGEANTLAQRAQKGDKSVLRKLYSAAFNPGLSGKGFTNEKIAEHNADFRDAWGVDPEKQGWAKDLEAKRPRRVEPAEEKTDSDDENEVDRRRETKEKGSGESRKRKRALSTSSVDTATNEESESLALAESTTTPASDKKKSKNRQKKKRQKIAHRQQQQRQQQVEPDEEAADSEEEKADEEEREEPVKEKEKTTELKNRKRSLSTSSIEQEEEQQDATVAPVIKKESATQKKNRRRRLKKKAAQAAKTQQ